MSQGLDQFERALHRRLRLQRMNVAEARQPRQLFVDAGIMLHRAGAERIEPGVDGIILLRQAHVVSQGFRLAEAG